MKMANGELLNFHQGYRLGLFLPLFIFIYGLFEFLYFKIPDVFLIDVMYHYGLVLPCAAIINFLHSGEQVMAARNILSANGVSLEVVRGCDGAGTIFLLAAAIISFSASLKDKFFGLLSGITLLVIINLIRIIGLYFVMAYYEPWFVPIHTYFAPSFIIILNCLFFAGWAQRVTNKTP
ncbi:MAG: exosortase family protein XrtM [Pseudomonadota bacterium]